MNIFGMVLQLDSDYRSCHTFVLLHRLVLAMETASMAGVAAADVGVVAVVVQPAEDRVSFQGRYPVFAFRFV